MLFIFLAKSTPREFNKIQVSLLQIAGLVCLHRSSKLFWVDSFSYYISLVIPWGNNSLYEMIVKGTANTTGCSCNWLAS